MTAYLMPKQIHSLHTLLWTFSSSLPVLDWLGCIEKCGCTAFNSPLSGVYKRRLSINSEGKAQAVYR